MKNIVKNILRLICPFTLVRYSLYHRPKYIVTLLLSRIRIHRKLQKIVDNCDRPLKVAFLVVFDSVFPLENVFRLMLSDNDFAPTIIVIPDISRGVEHQQKVMNQTYENLQRKYGDLVLLSHDNGKYVDISTSYDLYTTMNQYCNMTHQYYSIEYLAKKGCPVFTSRYFTDPGTVYSDTYNSLTSLAWLWKFYAEDERDKQNIVKYQSFLRIKNSVVVVGRPKMDSFHRINSLEKRKCIIIAPHHSMDPIGNNKFSIANFPQYADFFLELPKRYPNVDWVFRPHPLTLGKMVRSGRWTQNQMDSYITKMCSYKNVKYENGGEYLDTFAKSDGLIHDGASFLPEYFYTSSPQCYILKNNESENEQFIEFGKQLLKYTYKAYSKEDILFFIENVVIGGKDIQKESRDTFARENLMYNYPYASQTIINDIKLNTGRCRKSVNINQLAEVFSKRIGDGTRIWQFVVILKGAIIGKNCNICAQTFIENDVIVGDNVTIKCGVQLWDGLRVGNNVFIGPNVTFCNDKHPRSGNRGFKCEETIIEDDVSIGANATILPGITLGKGAVIGAGAVVTKTVPAGIVVVGNPARPLIKE